LFPSILALSNLFCLYLHPQIWNGQNSGWNPVNSAGIPGFRRILSEFLDSTGFRGIWPESVGEWKVLDFPLHDEISLLEPLIVDLLAHTGARVTEHLIGSVKERCESLVDEISQQCLRILQPQIDGIATTAVQSLQPTLSSMNVRPQTRSSSRGNSNVPSTRSSSSPTPFVASAVQSEVHCEFHDDISPFLSFNSST
jgi:hypothetical protein